MRNMLSRRNEQSSSDSLSLQAMPDEIVLKILIYLEIKNILKMSQTSKRFHAICQENTLWQIADISSNKQYEFKRVPTAFIHKLLGKECKELRLQQLKLKGKLDFNDESKLEYLYIKNVKVKNGVLEQILTSSKSLQVLRFRNLKLNFNLIVNISQNNSKTLLKLDLRGCQGLFQSIQHIVKNCTELTELNLFDTKISAYSMIYLANKLTPKIRQLYLGGIDNVRDQHITTLVKRCNTITDLDISGTDVTNNSITSIIEHLKLSLQKLNVNDTFVDCSKLSELKVMSMLKILFCQHLQYGEIISLQKQLPDVHIDIWEEKRAKPEQNELCYCWQFYGT